MARHGRLCWKSVVAAVVLVVAGGATLSAVAQNFKVIPPRVNEAQAKVLGGQVATILRDAQAPNAASVKVLDDFFMGNYYPAMTNDDPLALGQLAIKREQLFQRYLNAAKSQGARDNLNANTLKAMGAIAKGLFHPAVRYNAALIIGQLDAQLGAKPLPAGTETLLALVESDEFNKLPVPTAVKVGALIGLQRHARLGVDAPLAERITKAALVVANREELPEDASAKAYGWVRRQAAKILAIQFEKGLTPPVYQTFVRLISDNKSDLDDRCAVAQLLQPTMFSGAQGLNTEDIALALGQLARAVLELEAEEATDYLDKILAGGGFGGGSEGGRGFGSEGGRSFGGGYSRDSEGGGGFNMAALQEEEPGFEKRRLLDRTYAIVAGAQAVAAGASDELKERLTEFSTAIVTVADAAAPDNATTEAITDMVVDLQADIDRMVSKWAPARPAADEAVEEPAEDAEAPADAPPADAPAEVAAAPAAAAAGN